MAGKLPMLWWILRKKITELLKWHEGQRASVHTRMLSGYFLNRHYHSVLFLWNMVEVWSIYISRDVLKHSTGIFYFKHFIFMGQLGRMIWETLFTMIKKPSATYYTVFSFLGTVRISAKGKIVVFGTNFDTLMWYMH